ncbi:GGDEF domain-containing protein [Piscinibacter aquaticus]|uniref:diguanylate cyclase n=1 Tax=Piscinibacter aquaticus TaxID=392597 RepID=A0A5C6U0E3_9BURK|nr:GGDEF domain-containing protein [Piscinibacter aquaticus]
MRSCCACRRATRSPAARPSWPTCATAPRPTGWRCRPAKRSSAHCGPPLRRWPAAAGGAWFVLRARRRRRQAADLEMRDELTGQPDRRAVMAFAQEQFELCRRLGIELSVALVNLDRFKAINERHGQAAGDRVLRDFAEAAGNVLRGQERLGRYGGDEWLLVMPGTAIDEMPAVFERLRARLAAQSVHGLAQPHGLTLSMGAAGLTEGFESVEALVEEADRQLHRAKAEGRDTVRCARAGRVADAGSGDRGAGARRTPRDTVSA